MVRARALVLVLLFLPLAAAAPAEVEERPTDLPSFRFDGAAAALHGLVVYGGGQAHGTFHDEILEYDPSKERISVLTAHLPSPRAGLAAVSNGTHVFFLGGVQVTDDGARYTDEIVRFDGATAEVLDVRLPRPGAYWSAVWAGDRVYLLGGETCGDNDPCTPAENCTDDHDACPVLEFIPSANGGAGQVRELDVGFPRIRGAAAVWTGEEAYLYGGRAAGGMGYYLRSIVRFTPEDGLEVQNLVLPEERNNAVATWHDGKAYVFGGNNVSGRNGFKDTVYVHDPAEGSLYAHHLALPGRSAGHQAARIGDDVFLLGAGQAWEDIYRFRPETVAPPPGDGGGGDGTSSDPATDEDDAEPSDDDAPPQEPSDEPEPEETTAAPAPTPCDARPTDVTSHHDSLGRTTVHWRIDPACRAPQYAVWDPTGTKVGIQSSLADRTEYSLRVPSPGPGEHVYRVQPVQADEPFDAGEAVPAPPLVIVAEGVLETDDAVAREDDAQVASAPGGSDFSTAVFGGLAVLAIIALLLVVVASRRR